MERLTVNKNVSEMGIYELAHNCCYAQEGKARYRDFEMDMDARDFARNLMTTLTSDELPLEDDLFDEEILENLQYDPFADVGGLIALFYRNLCAIGHDVYFIPSKVNFELNRINGDEERNRVYHQKVSKIVFNERGWYMECDKDLEYGTGNILLDKFYKETWFLTKSEAEEALKRMEE